MLLQGSFVNKYIKVGSDKVCPQALERAGHSTKPKWLGDGFMHVVINRDKINLCHSLGDHKFGPILVSTAVESR